MHLLTTTTAQSQLFASHATPSRGFALVLVMAFLAVSLLVVGGLLSWTSQNAFQTQRYQDYQITLAVQNVAGEYTVARMHADLRDGGLSRVMDNWSGYGVDGKSRLEDNSDWEDYEFEIKLELVETNALLGPYGGMPVTNQVFEVRSGAQRLDTFPPMAAAVEEWVQVAEIPVFAFAALYDFDLSFITPPDENIALNGRVHSNKDIYTYPSGALTFAEHVTSAKTNYPSLHPNDLGTRTPGTVVYEKENGGQAGRMYLPGAGDNPRALIYAEYLTRAQLVITVYNDQILVATGHSSLNVTNVTNFVSTTASFRDRREQLIVHPTEIDVGNFVYEDYANLTSLVGVSPRILYVEDLRTHGTEAMPAVRLVNGEDLPPDGLIVVTPNPLYIWGNYNTGTKRAAAVVADAVTVLSEDWTDPGETITPALPTTVNASVLTGIVPSEAGNFDGGLFNALRLLENWQGVLLTYNGSIAALYRSEQALEPWRADVTVYYAPTRQWAFDPAFLAPDYLPWTPVVCTLVRTEWSIISPNQVFAE
jgi:hypothetical protein